ncbi:hypothetical protein [Actinomadura sp. WMMB 499]|uniref:hypothetical protein n=1 Tax=Actinomadura sp. WMMB 499 TaxID=1219491 RepID=UPI001248A8E9|nr:hypothetical protein [Actinomadura sp. WMMB 499]QFG22323.1 hypothetical protein F7P10_15495 [Actinomadura sp. WMMB 499]
MTESDDLDLDDFEDPPKWEADSPESVLRTVEMLATMNRGAWRPADLGNLERRDAEEAARAPAVDDDRIVYTFYTGDPHTDFLYGQAHAPATPRTRSIFSAS